MDFLHLKFFGIVLTCSCAPLWSVVHFTHMGLPMDQNTYLWKCWMVFLPSKFYGIISIWSCAASCYLPIWLIWACPLLPIRSIWAIPLARVWISETVGWIFCVRNSMKLSRQLYNILCICPFDPYGLSHGSECISCKPLDVYSLFEVLLNCLDL